MSLLRIAVTLNNDAMLTTAFVFTLLAALALACYSIAGR